VPDDSPLTLQVIYLSKRSHSHVTRSQTPDTNTFNQSRIATLNA
jgi:hypothetical protein